MKKVLVITYYWPPSGGSGVQRWLKFVKYLPEFGWQPFVFTPENPSFAIQDESLITDVPEEAEIIHFPIWEPYDSFLKLASAFGKKQKSTKPTELASGKISLFQKIAIWIRGNFFIPDPRVFWVRTSFKFLKDFIKDNAITTVITTGPPHSVHLIGYRLKKNNPNIYWLADFRDPWSEWGLLETLRVTKPVLKWHKKLELKVLSNADVITTVTPFYVNQLEKIGHRKVELLTNGFDEGDFKNLSFSQLNKFTIRHVGIINEKCNPRDFMLAVKELILENKEFAGNVCMEFIGDVHYQFRNFVASDPQLSSVTDFVGSISHQELIHRYGQVAVLLLVLTGYKDAEGYLPGKLFEYMATGLPIISIGPLNGDAASLLQETKAGAAINDGDRPTIKTTLLNLFKQWLAGSLAPADQQKASKYTRKELTRSLTTLLDGEKQGVIGN